MTVTLRSYRHPEDFSRVGSFLVETYQPLRQPSNWLQPRWEYMHYLCVPFFGLTRADLERIGIWEDQGRIVGVVHFEARLGQAYFQEHPDYPHLKADMLDYAEANLSALSPDGEWSLRAFVRDSDHQFESIVRARGYCENKDAGECMSRLDLRTPLPVAAIPDGFRVKSQAEDDDRVKINRVLHRGFDHPGEPPESQLEVRRRLEEAPHFRKELVIVAESPQGDFVSYCGVWYENDNRFALVEPVATDPAFRGLGLGRVCVLEALRRATEIGATVAYVGTDMPFYLSFGFKRMSACRAWQKSWTAGRDDIRPQQEKLGPDTR